MDVVCGYSIDTNPENAVEQATASINNPRMLLFFSPVNMFEKVVALLEEKYPESEICGSTTAVSYQHDMNWDGNLEGIGLSVISFGEDFDCVAGIIENVDEMVFDDCKNVTKNLGKLGTIDNTICFEMMSCVGREEDVLELLNEALRHTEIPVLGGCAGSEVDTQDVMISYNGTICENGCLYIFIHNKKGEIKIIVDDICKSTRRALMPTDVDIEKRIVYEFDGVPAAAALADELNMPISKLANELWLHPVGQVVGDMKRIIEIGEITPERGVVVGATVYGGVALNLLEFDDYIARINAFGDKLKREAPNAGFCLMVVCKTISKFLKNENWAYRMTKMFDGFLPQFAGFSGWGEQISHYHLNQAMIAVAFTDSSKK